MVNAVLIVSGLVITDAGAMSMEQHVSGTNNARRNGRHGLALAIPELVMLAGTGAACRV